MNQALKYSSNTDAHLRSARHQRWLQQNQLNAVPQESTSMELDSAQQSEQPLCDDQCDYDFEDDDDDRESDFRNEYGVDGSDNVASDVELDTLAVRVTVHTKAAEDSEQSIDDSVFDETVDMGNILANQTTINLSAMTESNRNDFFPYLADGIELAKTNEHLTVPVKVLGYVAYGNQRAKDRDDTCAENERVD
ncbi:hypothetical protein BDB00DRAFT_786881 [Zychaea mexicana]|uniref:uncharacterized protein n=1 Tax=Zychaea mexicana TaxID=64656 RepID=UPI0022FF0C79|nr:uncharacterized protein BDB00DRAFT_786881 [Zychaea mexicana]KAI9494767.1 hypothetical protein BDB00DRAFT_786881 [Zychaea mexicana]